MDTVRTKLSSLQAQLGECRRHLLDNGEVESARLVQRAIGHIRRARNALDEEPGDLIDVTPEFVENDDGPATPWKARRAHRRTQRLETGVQPDGED